MPDEFTAAANEEANAIVRAMEQRFGKENSRFSLGICRRQLDLNCPPEGSPTRFVKSVVGLVKTIEATPDMLKQAVEPKAKRDVNLLVEQAKTLFTDHAERVNFLLQSGLEGAERRMAMDALRPKRLPAP